MKLIRMLESFEEALAQAQPGDVLQVMIDQPSYDAWFVTSKGILGIRGNTVFLNGVEARKMKDGFFGLTTLDNSPALWYQEGTTVFRDGTVVSKNVQGPWMPCFSSDEILTVREKVVFLGDEEICSIPDGAQLLSSYPDKNALFLREEDEFLLNGGECIFKGNADRYDVTSRGLVLECEGEFLNRQRKVLLNTTDILYDTWAASSRGLFFEYNGEFTLYVTD